MHCTCKLKLLSWRFRFWVGWFRYTYIYCIYRVFLIDKRDVLAIRYYPFLKGVYIVGKRARTFHKDGFLAHIPRCRFTVLETKSVPSKKKKHKKNSRIHTESCCFRGHISVNKQSLWFAHRLQQFKYRLN